MHGTERDCVGEYVDAAGFLIGFDNEQADMGVGEYIDAAGFTPQGVCLLLTSVDFVLSHHGFDPGKVLPPDVCARDGHDRNPHRERQEWTAAQLRQLIAQLHAHGIKAYLTVFTRFYNNRFHHEWLSDHPETFQVFRGIGPAHAVNAVSRLADGGYFEDYFIPQLVRVLEDYGFDGWHGADGWGPLSGAIYRTSIGDDMAGQFAEATEIALPDVVTRSCDDDVDALEARIEWIWQNARQEWIDFWADRWTQFWTKALDALHAAGKEAFINSAWGRAPWESLYRYGVDHRRIAEAGVDGVIVETVAAGLSMDPRPYAADVTRHADFLSMLMLMRAALPDTRLIFLHNTHDTVEEWDAIRHKPTLLEKEIYSLSNVHHQRADGRLRPCADGFLVCLGDGLDDWHWRWLGERWELAWSGDPVRTLGATLVWSNALIDAQNAYFTETRGNVAHRLALELMTEGAPVQSTADVSELDGVIGAVLVLNHHLLPEDELARVLAYKDGPIILIGRDMAEAPEPDARIDDRSGPQSLSCLVYGAEVDAPVIESWDAPDLPDDLMTMDEPMGYWDHFEFAPVSSQFVQACARVVAEVSDAPLVIEQADDVLLMASEQAGGAVRVALKNKTRFYARPRLDMRREIANVQILTEYPSLLVQPSGSEFSVRVPPEGLTVVEVAWA
ncbi:MAG: hypothetical protein ACOCZ7_04835 [Armatimonadota bacterium]